MLVLSRKRGEAIVIGETIEIKVLKATGSRVTLGISAPHQVSIQREEMRRRKHEHGQMQTTAARSVPHAAVERKGHEACDYQIPGADVMVEVLIVDDSSVERCLAGALLGAQSNVRVLFADNGRNALEKVRQSKPDVIVTDLVMPEMNGLEFLRASRKEFPSIPVILMTAHGNESLAVDALHDGAASYVPKAKRSERLVETVQRVLARTQVNRIQVGKLSQCFGILDATFCLDNDPECIPPVVDYVQQMISGLKLSDETERIRACVALEEALVNAMCHGNLELTTDDLDKSRSEGPNRLHEMIAQRCTQLPYRDRKIFLDVHVTNCSARFVVKDSGHGFDQASAYQAMRRNCFDGGSSSGVALMNMLMDEVSYNDEGNELTLIKISDN